MTKYLRKVLSGGVLLQGDADAPGRNPKTSEVQLKTFPFEECSQPRCSCLANYFINHILAHCAKLIRLSVQLKMTTFTSHHSTPSTTSFQPPFFSNFFLLLSQFC